jgi:hypothetical protein
MARSILIMAVGADGTMAGIIATGIMAASVGMAAVTAKSPYENLLSVHAGEEFSNGHPGPDRRLVLKGSLAARAGLTTGVYLSALGRATAAVTPARQTFVPMPGSRSAPHGILDRHEPYGI